VRVPRRVCWGSPRGRLLLSAIECSIRTTPSPVAQHLPPVGQSVRGRSRRPVQSKYLPASSEVESPWMQAMSATMRAIVLRSV
jgi:hypothetical protein